MIWWLALCLLVLPFSLVLLQGAPYLPTRKKYANQALDLLNLQPGQIFVDLGSGDGAVLIEAARRGYRCYGYELNPLVWLISKLRTLRYGRRVTIYLGNFWRRPLPLETAGVFVFLLDKFMPKLDAKLSNELKAGSRVLSYTFQIPGKKPINKRGASFLYQY